MAPDTGRISDSFLFKGHEVDRRLKGTYWTWEQLEVGMGRVRLMKKLFILMLTGFPFLNISQ